MNNKGAFGKALASILIVYTIAISSVADYLAHQCGSFWFDYTFELSIPSLWMFGVLGAIVFVIALSRHFGTAVQWWFWIAFSVIVLVANGAYAATAPVNQTNAAGANIQCKVRS